MSDIQDLYQEVILDHNRRPRNQRAIDTPDSKAEGYNPLCGDRVTVYVRLQSDVVEEVTFEGSGCAISTASASLMTESIKGKTLAEAKTLFEQFHSMVTGSREGVVGSCLGKLEVFSGVCKYPARVKCATLVWHTVNAALQSENNVVTTE